jgi:hypothetical protein
LEARVTCARTTTFTQPTNPGLGTDIELVKDLIRDGDRCRDNDCQSTNIEQGLTRAREFYKDASDVVLLVRVSQNMQEFLQLGLD